MRILLRCLPGCRNRPVRDGPQLADVARLVPVRSADDQGPWAVVLHAGLVEPEQLDPPVDDPQDQISRPDRASDRLRPMRSLKRIQACEFQLAALGDRLGDPGVEGRPAPPATPFPCSGNQPPGRSGHTSDQRGRVPRIWPSATLPESCQTCRGRPRTSEIPPRSWFKHHRPVQPGGRHRAGSRPCAPATPPIPPGGRTEAAEANCPGGSRRGVRTTIASCRRRSTSPNGEAAGQERFSQIVVVGRQGGSSSSCTTTSRSDRSLACPS